MKVLINCLLGILLCAILFNCKKEYSYEGGNNPTPVPVTSVDSASFTLVGAPSDCSVTLPAAFPVVGENIGQASVTVSVNVTKAGDYKISTDTVDNIYFEASGSFSKTGVQNVRLKGYGTPDSALNVTLSPSTGFSRCSFLLSVIPASPLATYVIESGYGNPNPCTYTVNGNYVKGQAISASNTVKISVTAISVGNFAISTGVVNGIQFYYAGTFTTTGSQPVVLTAIGVPLAPGIFSFSPTIVGPAPLGGKACAFDVTFQ